MKYPTLCLLALGLLLPGSAFAQKVNGIALMPIESDPADELVAQRIVAAMREAVKTTPGFEEKGPVAMQLEEARLSFSCFDESPKCMSQVAAVFDADLLVWGKLKRNDDTFKLELHVLDARAAKGLRDQVFTATGHTAADTLANQAAAFSVGREALAQASLLIDGEPRGARIQVDGTERGTAPLELPVQPGKHQVTISAEGFTEESREVEVEPGKVKVVEFALQGTGPDAVATPDISGRREPDASPSRTGLWLGVGSGVVAVAAAGSGIFFGTRTLDLKEEAGDTPAGPEYDQVSDDFESAQLMTNVSWGVAAAAAAASIYFLVFYEDDSGGTSAALSPTAEGLLLHGTF